MSLSIPTPVRTGCLRSYLCGGPSEVFRFVKKGYMQDQYLKFARMKRQADIEEDLRRLQERHGEKGDLDDRRLRSVGLIK